jgi:hypothetical protein
MPIQSLTILHRRKAAMDACCAVNYLVNTYVHD